MADVLTGEQQGRIRFMLYHPVKMLMVEDLEHDVMKKERLLQHIDDIIKACAIAKDYLDKEEYENGR